MLVNPHIFNRFFKIHFLVYCLTMSNEVTLPNTARARAQTYHACPRNSPVGPHASLALACPPPRLAKRRCLAAGAEPLSGKRRIIRADTTKAFSM